MFIVRVSGFISLSCFDSASVSFLLSSSFKEPLFIKYYASPYGQTLICIQFWSVHKETKSRTDVAFSRKSRQWQSRELFNPIWKISLTFLHQVRWNFPGNFFVRASTEGASETTMWPVNLWYFNNSGSLKLARTRSTYFLHETLTDAGSIRSF